MDTQYTESMVHCHWIKIDYNKHCKLHFKK